MKTCTIPGCGRKMQARGWCQTHYTRWYQHGDPNVVLRPGRPAGSGTKAPCTADGCDNPAKALGLCDKHYHQKRRADAKNRTAVCTVDGCDKRHKARGMCNTHYSQWKRTVGRFNAWQVTCGVCGRLLGPLPASGRPWPLLEQHQCGRRAA